MAGLKHLVYTNIHKNQLTSSKLTEGQTHMAP